MINILERTALQIKSMKLLFFVPILVYYLIIPLCVYGYTRNPIGTVHLFTKFADVGYTFVPIVSIWWIFLYLREVVEGEGKEIFILGGGITPVLINFYILHSVCMFPVFFFFDDKDGSVMDFYLQMLVITFFMYGLMYLLSVVIRDIAISLLVVLIYSIFSTSYTDVFNWLQYGNMNNVDWLEQACVFLLMSIVFWVFAHWKSKRM